MPVADQALRSGGTHQAVGHSVMLQSRVPRVTFGTDGRPRCGEQGASPLDYSGGQGARKVRTLDIPFPRLVLAHRGFDPHRESGIGNRESGIGNRESGIEEPLGMSLTPREASRGFPISYFLFPIPYKLAPHDTTRSDASAKLVQRLV
jgi:hypothetical protein